MIQASEWNERGEEICECGHTLTAHDWISCTADDCDCQLHWEE